MKVVVISNFYPPHSIGGYELGCRDVVDALRARGHDVTVLTSTFGVGRAVVQQHVHRVLHQEPFGPGWAPRRMLSKPAVYRRNRALARCLLQELRPDVVYQWNPALISLAPVFAADDLGIPIVYFVSDGWMVNWERWPSPTLRRCASLVLERSTGARSIRSLDLRDSHFASRHLRDATAAAGRGDGQAKVLPWGVDLAMFPYRQRERGRNMRLLYAGQLAPHKGVRTALEALRILIDRHGFRDIELTIAGTSVFPAYERELRRLAATQSLASRVRFLGPMPRREIASLHADHDVFVFPSVWQEPFSLALLEAMACGTTVVGTDTGGTTEVLRHEETGLIFAAGDAQSCAAQVLHLIERPELAQRLSLRARAVVEERHALGSLIDGVEASLREAVLRRADPDRTQPRTEPFAGATLRNGSAAPSQS